MAAKKIAPKAAVKAKKPAVKAPARRRVGRPASWKPEYEELTYKFCLLGASDERLAEMFGVAVSTIYLWKQSVPEFSEAASRGKELADAEIAHSLFHRARGYSHPDEDIKAINGEIVITATTKHYPPDTGAATLWLKNRQPKVWRDKVENVHTGLDGGPIEHSLKVTFVESPRG